MRNVITILRREYLERVRTRAFVISTIGAPLLLLAFIAVPVIMERNNEAQDRSLTVVDRTGRLASPLLDRLEEAGYTVEIAAPDSPEADAARARAESGDLAAILELDEATLTSGSARWVSLSPPPTVRRFVVVQAITSAALDARVADSGSAPDLTGLLSGGSLEFVSLRPGDAAEEEINRDVGMAAAFIGGMLLYMTLLIYGSVVARAVLEEKTGRIVEIIVSSVPPWQLLLGKIVGVGAVGLTQLAVWVGSVALLLALGVPMIVPMLSDSGALENLVQALPGAGVLAFFLASFILGYFLFASFFAAVGAISTTERETNQLQFPVVLLLIAAFFLLMPILDDPDTTFATVMSLVPLFSPILMFGRVAAGAATAWEAALSLVLLVVAIFVAAWLVGRIYRVGILMQGKRPTIPEMWRWLREA